MTTTTSIVIILITTTTTKIIIISTENDNCTRACKIYDRWVHALLIFSICAAAYI